MQRSTSLSRLRSIARRRMQMLGRINTLYRRRHRILWSHRRIARRRAGAPGLIAIPGIAPSLPDTRERRDELRGRG